MDASSLRAVCEVRGPFLVERAEQLTRYREKWYEGGCTHVVLDVKTRRRVERPCPDCVRPLEMR